ncbi:hypothetical protein MD484_g7578, partial [Candolleomyces efflorescens]
MASPPNESSSHASPDTATLPTNVEDITVRVDNASGTGVLVDLDDVYLDGEQDQEAGSSHSSSSEDVEIYLNDLGLDASGTSGRVFGIQMADEPSAADSPIIPSGGRAFTSPRQDSTPANHETSSTLSAPPLLAPSHWNVHNTDASASSHNAAKGTTTSIPTSSTTPDIPTNAGPTTPTTTIGTDTSPIQSTKTPPPSALQQQQLESLELRNQLLSPVTVVDSPRTPPATKMSTVPLPDMDDHDDPTTLLPRSMEQMDIREAEAELKRSPQDKARMRGLTVVGGGMKGAGVSFGSTPPPASPLPALPGPPPATAPPNMASFPTASSSFVQHHHLDSHSGATSRTGSILSTPTVGAVMQSTTSYTQSQPLPQLPTFAPALSVINEGTKDDLHLDVIGGGSEERMTEYGVYAGEGEDFQTNRAEATQHHHQQRQSNNSSNVTILPMYQQYGTITVSNSVVSFTNNNSSTTTTGHSTTPPSTSAPSPDHGGDLPLNGQHKTPNVYINGLPPHFPEEQLHALAAPYGEVKSVRTFTRHVRDSESGYGFVLFASVEAAERCIIALRQYRNLHPTFSKQVHKIPGTIYAQVNTNMQGSDGNSSGYHWNGGDVLDDEEASFKARMEALADPTSTNLYMEGLPLSMDEPTLSALVSPHRVVSSRFFQTRLSNPPRIIAFVRLDTRGGAEEVIERLHGRMVRGWNDAGSRISVRFADTAEQRELRRQERTTTEGAATGEASPGRLTIAQAALLNLRGQDLRTVGGSSSVASGSPLATSLPSVTSPLAMNSPTIIGTRAAGWAGRDPPPHSASLQGVSGREIIGSSRDYAVTSALSGLALGGAATGGVGGGMGRIVRLGNGAADVDYGSAFAGSPIGTIGLQQQQQHQRQYATLDGKSDGMTGMGIDYSAIPGRRESGRQHQLQGSVGGREGMMDPTMKALLESLGGGSFGGSSQQEYNRLQLERGLGAYDQLQYHHQPASVQSAGYSGSGVASTHTGYTPAEEYIMRAHAETAMRQRELLQQQHQAAAQRKRPTPLDLGRPSGGRRQDEGGADIGMGVRGYRAQASFVGMNEEEVFHAQGRGEEMDQGQLEAGVVEQQQQQGGHHAHTRATTHPHQQLHQQQRNSMALGHQAGGASSSMAVGGPSAAGRGHYQRNSMSVSSTTVLRTPQHASTATMGGNGNGQVESQQAQQQHQKRMSVGGRSSYQQSVTGSQVQSSQRQELYEDSLSNSPASSTDSPSLISPALTYSSQTHTPSTLSPATPFFGSFNSQGEGFRGAGVEGATGAKGIGVVESAAGGGKSGAGVQVGQGLKARLA